MTLSSVATNRSADNASSASFVEYKYDLRLEVGVKPGSGPTRITSIFHELVKKMRAVVDADKPFAVLTATDQLFLEKKEMSSDEFQKAFKVDQMDGKNSKILLGFKLHTRTSLYEIKQRIMQDFLIPHDLFLKEQAGGFENGLKMYTYGFLKHDHPDHPEISNLSARFARLISGAWKPMDKNDKKNGRTNSRSCFMLMVLQSP